MSDDLQGVGAVPEGTGADKPGEGVGAGGPIDLTKLPEFRRVQGQYDRRIAELQKERDKLASAVDELQQQLEVIRAQQEVLAAAADLTEEERARLLNDARAKAEIERIKRENEQLRRQLAAIQERQEFMEYHMRSAEAMGINPADPELYAAIEFALQTGDVLALEAKKGELARKYASARQQQQPQQPPPIATIPATGSAPISQAERERRRREYFEKKKELPQGNVEAHYALRQLYRDVLEPNEW